ncbi:hypothetical protein KUTeg_006447 [Tegillarca granosa]|uniref:Ig-like domain-containing protein n=1 Tax=Tegillarca granosa TaxID=220873 RepID=A0ABQ9FGH8_TEGGR|nr:hypothetical protein KUTeg_006447 [Tegillarca granosa]
MSGYTTGTVLYEGDNSQIITCQQSGGYPLSRIAWSCNGQTGTQNSSGTVANPPSVTISLQNKTENDTNAEFTCNADGFPTNYTYHGWNQYIGNALVRSYTDFTGMLSESNRKLTINKVTFEDTGSYHCVVENGFHGRKADVLQQGSSYFDVKDATWTLRGSSNFAVAGEAFTLTCNPQDFRAVAVTWKRLDIDTSGTGTNRAFVEANGCGISSGSDTQYQYTCEPGPVYKLTIPANVKTNIPVSSISIQAGNVVIQQVTVIYENIPKTFCCIKNGCRPKASVTVTTTGVTKGQLTESITQNGDLIITRMSLL